MIEFTDEQPQGTFAIGGLVFETDGPAIETPALDALPSYDAFLALVESDAPQAGSVVGGLFEV